ncbi:hypothetical protein DXG01_008798, partial [Tephrocybe rancida]
NDEKRKPLTYKYNAETFQANMPPPAQPVLIPQSLRIECGYGPCMESFVEDAKPPSAIS